MLKINLPNVEFSSVMWNAADTMVEPGNDTSYGCCGIAFTVQGPEDSNFVIQAAETYWLPEDTPSYLVAYQRCYEHLKNSVNLSPDQLDQLEQWNQKIVQEVNNAWTEAGLPAPDLNANDWSMSAPFFTTYATKVGEASGGFTLQLGDSHMPEGPGSGF